LEMARIILPRAQMIYTVTVESDRALQAKELAEDIESIGGNAISCASYEEALEKAKGQDNPIIVFGSLYFIGEILGGL